MIRNFIYSYFSSLWELTNEMSPYLLLGFLFAGILHVFIKQETISKRLGKKDFKSVLYASLLGIPLPLCSCGVIPTGVSFHKNGASKGASVSFLISTPQTGVDSILVTYSMLGLPFAILRPIVALVTGVFGGMFANFLNKEELQPQFQLADSADSCSGDSCSCHSEPSAEKSKMHRMFHYAFVEFMQDIAKWLIIGLLLAAFISTVLPDSFFSEVISNPLLSLLIVLVASVPLYICATSSVPIVAAMVMKGLSPGAALVFLMAGPATNIATMTVIGKSLGKHSLIAYLASIITGALVFGLAIDWLFPQDLFFSALQHQDHQHTFLPEWFYWANTAILAGLLINSLLLKYRKPSVMETPNFSVSDTAKIEVHGMTCNHCKKNVETNLSKLDGVDEAVVDLASKTVAIKGSNIKLEAVSALINELGYDYKGKLSS